MTPVATEVKKELTEDEKQKFARIIRLDEEFKRKNAGKVRRVEVGHVTVDSGRIIIIDPCHLHDGRTLPNGLRHSSEGWIDPTTGQATEKREEEMDAIGCIDETTGESKPAVPVYHSSAVASSTGYGDGTYPVYATILDGRVLKLEIEFV
jgi:hypothetical protein